MGRSASQLLIQRGSDINAVSQAGASALHEAALSGDRSLVAMLRSSGARTDLRNRQGATPADIASSKGYRDVVQVLREPVNQHVATAQ